MSPLIRLPSAIRPVSILLWTLEHEPLLYRLFCVILAVPRMGALLFVCLRTGGSCARRGRFSMTHNGLLERDRLNSGTTGHLATRWERMPPSSSPGGTRGLIRLSWG